MSRAPGGEPSHERSPTGGVFAALADPTRRSILDLLWRGPRNAGEIGARFPHLSQPGVSRHLKVLREVGLVRVTVRAQQRVYAVEPARFAGVEEWVRKYLADETVRLGRLAQLVERSPKKKNQEKQP
ncbi:MAG TPA: metalloregulator ArsR/SmtB family transcription factor [Thermoplasmata archaeon]|nr:metalloregulator ArsR/SmtB family transcription factor [Thermoplasmata archaeon]